MKFFAIVSGIAFAALLVSPALADAPALEIRPAARDCQQPFEIFGSGLEPSLPVLVSFSVDGGPIQGGVGGQTEPDGRFYSPIPMVLLPCATGGHVEARIKVGEREHPMVAVFDVLPRGGTPPPTPRGPSVGNTPAGGSEGSDAGFVLGGVLLVAAGAAVGAGFARRANRS